MLHEAGIVPGRFFVGCLMTSVRSLSVFVCLASLLCPLGAASETIEVVPDEYIVQRRELGGVQAQQAMDRPYEIHERAEFFDVVVPKKAAVQALSAKPRKEPIDWVKVAADCKEIMKDPSVATCEPNILLKPSLVPNDEYLILQWGLFDISDNAADIRTWIAWDKGTGTKATLIGVIDSGIYWSHPDLTANLWSNPGEQRDGIDNDGNGYVDDFFGVNTAVGSNNPDDCNGHGTHVSGIIGASGNNGIGVTGVNWTASLIVASTDDGSCDGSFSVSHSIKAYDYFSNLKKSGHNIRVINASFGSTSFSPAAYEAIKRLASVDILLIAAAGNQSTNIDILPYYPAAYDLPNVIAVGATGPTFNSPSYSNYGQSVDIAAPGGDRNYYLGKILSTWSPLAGPGTLYNDIQGTSMAAPMVTGAIGLLASQRPYLTGTHLKNILLQSADAVGTLAPFVAGGRFLNVGAMSLAADPADNCPSDPNKLEAGICGCGTADSYRDSDNDATYDCLDQCPSDAAKKAVGVCGCGVADVDTDKDGTADCVDQCPADAAKRAAGVCGCGIADVDANANGVTDCSDPVVSNVVPPTPKVTPGKKSITVTMTPMAGIKYYITVAVQAKGKGKPKTSNYIGTTQSVKIGKLPPGATVSVKYAYMVDGTPQTFSYYSGARKVKVK